jgi:TolB-like protein/Tfp pilus assembly protein PilF
MTAPDKAVFLSYASQDAAAAQRICTSLRDAGIEVWFDQSELRGGDTWDQKIRRQIRECTLFIPLISDQTQARPEGYFRLEWRLADLRTHLMGRSRAFIVPVCVDETSETSADVPDSFTAVQWTRLPGGVTSANFTRQVALLLAPEDHPLPLHGRPVMPVAPTGPSGRDAVPEKSIAVLPFANLSADPDNDYFSEGLAEEILNALCQVADLRVASRNSAFSFKGKDTELGEIARKLHVANLLEGSVRRVGKRVRITVRLVDAGSGFPLWSDRYDREMDDIFETQDDIARAVIERLRVSLARDLPRATNNPEAYELYLKGRHFWHQRSQATLRAAIQCFEQCIKIDPDYALAYAGLADCHGILRAWGWVPGEICRAPALTAVTKAMALAPELWETNFAKALYTLHFETHWREAEAYFKKAIEINPRSSLAPVYYGLYLVADGRAEEAAAWVSSACRLDPLSATIHGHASTVLCGIGDFEDAERIARLALESHPEFVLGLLNRGLALSGLGRHAEAIESLERGEILSRAPLCLGLVGLGYARAGRHEDARLRLREMDERSERGEYIAQFARFTIYAALGDVPAARATLAKALEETTSPISLCSCAALLASAYTDPETERLRRRFFGLSLVGAATSRTT